MWLCVGHFGEQFDCIPYPSQWLLVCSFLKIYFSFSPVICVVLYMVLWWPTLSQSSVIFQSMSKWWLLLVHLWNANGDDAHHLSNKNMVCWCFSLRSMDGILHMRAKCWRRPWCALSMVRDQSQIELYIHWIAVRGGYGLAAEWSLYSCVLPCLSLPLENAAYSFRISGVHGFLEDTMDILWKLGCGPLKSCSSRDACAWTECLQLIVAAHLEMRWTLWPPYTKRQPVFSLRRYGHCLIYILSGVPF